MSGGGLSFALALALVHYSDPGHNYKDNPVRITFNVADAAVATAKVQQAGKTVLSQPAPVPELGNRTVGVVKDPDGYMLELMQR